MRLRVVFPKIFPELSITQSPILIKLNHPHGLLGKNNTMGLKPKVGDHFI
jgi:hypothetical protein